MNDTQGPLTSDALARYRNLHRVTMPACYGSCQQRRALCPTSVACEAGEPDDDPLAPARGVIYSLIGCLAAWTFVAAFVLVLRS